MNYLNIQEWAKTDFGNALLFNKKKINRLIGIAGRLTEAKGTSGCN